jgi:alcohol dehydrogenase
MPYVMAFNERAIADKMARLAAWLGLKDQSFAGMLDWVLRLREETGAPHKLADLKVDGARIDEIAAAAEVDPTAGGNPIKLDAAAAKQIFTAALEGKV